MSVRTLLIVALALVFGVSAVLAVSSLRPATVETAPATEPVVVAAVDVPPGTGLTADVVKTRDWPKELVPPGAITKVEDALERVPFTQLSKDEPVLESRLAKKGAGRGMSALTKKGMRAVTIPASMAGGVAGFILPGNRVDVLLTVTGQGDKDASGGGTTVRLLQNVEVRAVNQRLDVPQEHKIALNELRAVTLLVTPQEDAMLALAQTKGTLHLSLRNGEDDHVVKQPRPITLKDLQLLVDPPKEEPKQVKAAPAPAPEPPPPPPPVAQIRTLRGTHEGVVLLQPVTPNPPQQRSPGNR